MILAYSRGTHLPGDNATAISYTASRLIFIFGGGGLDLSQMQNCTTISSWSRKLANSCSNVIIGIQI